MIDIDGHGVPTQARRYLDPAPLAEIDALREAFRAHGEPELQRALEELDCFEVFREVRCPVLLAVATRPVAGQALFEPYLQGLERDLATLPDNVEVVRLDATHAVAFEQPRLVADLIGRYLDDHRHGVPVPARPLP